MTALRVAEPTVRRIVELASRAASMHNSQPWRWRWDGEVLELSADRERQLSAADPSGRNLMISLGGALHQALLAAGALGRSTTVTRFPEPAQPDIVARITLEPGQPATDDATALVAMLEERCTDRRRFTSWPVPDERLLHLAKHATVAGARAMPLLEVSERFRTELLINRALDLQDRDVRVRREQEAWIEHGASDGLPAVVVPRDRDLVPHRPSRFSGGRLQDGGTREVEGSDALIVIYDLHDDPHSWLAAGEGLSAMWLAATVDGLSVVPLSSVIEVDETRDSMQLDVLGGLAHPLMVVRVGWQAISRSELPRTPRRPVDEILSLR
jgi:hypothetical protein